jgi:hypothetical protein
MFVAAMQARAFTASSVAEIVEAGRTAIPVGTEYRQVIEDVIAWHSANPSNWTAAWQLLQAKWGTDDIHCPEGLNQAFNIDAKLHGGYILLGLLYGNGDFAASMRITMRSGQDADSSTQNVGSILGTWLGLSQLPAQYTSGLNPNLTFEGSPYTFNAVIEASTNVARQIVLLNGGQVIGSGESEVWSIPDQGNVSFPLVEQWPATSNNRPSITAPVIGAQDLQVSFSASATDANGIASYLWSFGDLSFAAGPSVAHTYRQPGVYRVTLYVADLTGNTNYRVQDITVGAVTPTPSPSPTVTPTPPPDAIFSDGFESGGLGAWTSQTTDGGDLSATAAAALIGTYGLRGLLDDNASLYLTDDTPAAEPRYRARFYFDPNSIGMANGNEHIIFQAYAGASTAIARVDFRRSGGAYQIRARVRNDGSGWANTAWVSVSDSAHAVEVAWLAASGPGQNNGQLTLWIDGNQAGPVSAVDNDTRRVDRVRLGAVSGIDTGTRGAYYFDDFVSRRLTAIGP